MYKLNLFFKRFIRRVRYSFQLRDIYNWKAESCSLCGHKQRIAWTVSDELWSSVMKNYQLIVCLECFLEKASENNIKINKDSIKIYDFI